MWPVSITWRAAIQPQCIWLSVPRKTSGNSWHDEPRSTPLSSKSLTSLIGQLRASQSEYKGVIPLHEPTVFDYKPGRLSGHFLKLRRRKEIHDLHFHDLRREAPSWLFQKGLNPVEVPTIPDHKDTKMLICYAHLRAEHLVGRLGSFIPTPHRKSFCCFLDWIPIPFPNPR